MSASFVSTSGILARTEFPQFNSWPSSRYDKPGGPFSPHTGDQYVYSQIADVTYKRLTREIAVPAGGGDLTFWTLVRHRARLGPPVRGGPDAGRKRLDDAAGRERPHDHRAGRQLRRPGGATCTRGSTTTRRSTAAAGTCTATGTSGAWNAASGNSAGWQQWRINLNAYAGRTVEISIAYASDWAVQNLGVFLDDVTLPDGTSTSFEAGLDGWQVTGPPAGSGPNANNWTRTDAAGFPVGASISTPDSILMGFGFEGISTQASRNAVMGRVLDHLLD